MLEFRILGPLEVRDGERLIELPRKKQRALLALMLLRPGKIVSSDVLVDGLWGEDPPRTARAALQNSVSQLRRALGPDVLGSRPGGYLLDVSPEQIDLGRFERLAAEGRATADEERAEKLREALVLWRGPPLANLTFEPFAAVEIVRLEELRTAILEDLIDAELALGSGNELVGELETLISENPFRERLRGQLMLALYRGGRQAEALEAYHETRRTLVEELGIEPSAPLRELEQAILRQDDSLAPPVRELEAPPEERRKTVTVLFAELTLAEALDPELLRSTTSGALSSVRRVLTEHGGTIEQRAGEEVMGVFGVPVAHEDDPLRAARAALELEVEIAALADVLERQGRGRIGLRVGIETGEVLAGADAAGHGFIAGAAIRLAKHLQQSALGDEILVGEAARALLGDAAAAVPTSGGRHGAFRLLELVEGVPALPRHLEAPLGDREAELAALRDVYERAVAERRCRVLLILGEAGIGKTRLVKEFAKDLDDATVLVGRCVSYGKGATYLPLAEIIEQAQARFDFPTLLAADAEADRIVQKLGELAGERKGSGSSGEEFWAVRRLFEAVASERPLVVAFEDLHWAEPTLLELVEYLGRQAGGAAILVLAIARPDLVEERPDWSREEDVTLTPLLDDDCERLIDNLAEVPQDLRTRIVRTSGGNPLFLEQLLAYTQEGTELETVPPSLESLLASRLDRLDANQLSVLQRAAVTGREFSPGAVAHLSPDRQEAAIDEHLSALVRLGLLRPSRPSPTREHVFRFHHALIRDAAYNSIPKKLRAELHERAADWLDLKGAGQDELAGYHLEQAYRLRLEPGSPDGHARRLASAAGERLAAAGVRAAKSGDVHSASNLLTRASSLLSPDELAARDLLTELGLVLWRSGEISSAEQTFERALETAVCQENQRAELRARIELANFRIMSAREGGADELLKLAGETLPVFEQLGDDRALGRIWFFLAFIQGGNLCHYRASTEAASRALEYYRRSAWPLTPCLQELAAGLYYGPTPVPEAIDRCRALLEEADQGGRANIIVFLAGLEAMEERFDSARKLASSARQIYEELAWTLNVWANHAAAAGDIELLAGNWPQAEHVLAESCRRLEDWGLRGQLATQATQLGEALYGQGRYDEAVQWSRVAESSTASYDAGAQFSWRALRGKLLAQQGSPEEAERLSREAVTLAAATDSVSQRAHVLMSHVEVLRLAGRASEATDVLNEAIGLLEAKGNVAAARRARSLLVEAGDA